jgi:hypothetical protein
MNQIRGQALSCDFSIPLPDNQEPNFNEVNVLHKLDPASPGNIIYKVNSEADCSATLGGWFYDDPTDPQNIRLCPVSCDLVKSAPGQVDIELGCQTEIIPPE